ncbi:MAG: oligosaccharide flippase family protein, partial [Paraglaciecola polaris]|uniref:oligosaccharide flippase family protein n=1 Tax=Paraglaciecola polaris TaxID=222814 RepID=UPI00300240FE
MSYAKKTMIGTLWNAISNMGNQLISLLVYILLARLLSIEQFGLIAFSFLILELGSLFVSFGINQNLIQKNEWDDEFAKTCFWFLLGVSSLIGATIAFVIAPLSEHFYEAGSGTILLFLALVPILNGVTLVNSANLEREFKNKRLSMITLVSVTIGGIISVVLALNDFGVWSVIWGRLFQAAFNS